MPQTGFFASLLSSGFLQMLASLGVLFGAKSIFFEWVERNEIAFRNFNKKKGYVHKRISVWRFIAIGLCVMGMGAAIFTLFYFNFTYWYASIGIFFALFWAIKKLVDTWPVTDIPAWVGPGIHLKVPGLIDYTHVVVAVDTRTVSLTQVVDADGELVDINLAYRWGRGPEIALKLIQLRKRFGKKLRKQYADEIREVGEALWLGVAEVTNLEGSNDALVSQAALKAVGATHGLAHPTSETVEKFSALVKRYCGDGLLVMNGAVLYDVHLLQSGPVGQVMASKITAQAIKEAALTIARVLFLPGSFATIAKAWRKHRSA